jgi:hypothetical protein
VSPELIANLRSVTRTWIEYHDEEKDACDVIVQLDDQAIYTSLFVTLPYLHRQMELNYEFSKSVDDAVPVRFVSFDTPHLLVENLDRDTIEDTIDNLLALETFESLFTRVTQTEEEASGTSTETSTSSGNGHRATQEVAAVVLQEVLVVEED